MSSLGICICMLILHITMAMSMSERLAAIVWAHDGMECMRRALYLYVHVYIYMLIIR